MFKTYGDIIDLWPSLAAFADLLGVPKTTAGSMKRNNALPSGFFLTVVRGAQDLGRTDVTIELLCDIAERKLKQKDSADAPRETEETNRL